MPGNVASPGQFNPEKDSISNTNVSYANGFTMEFDYSFQKDHADQNNQDNAKTGYVQADILTDRKRVSFVGNSGVKFGTTTTTVNGKTTTPEFEINILDVANMMTVARGDVPKPKITVDGYVERLSYKKEPINTLMTGVRYGGDYTKMADWGNPLTPPASPDQFYKLLTDNATRNTGHMMIVVSKDAGGTFTVVVGVMAGNVLTPTYAESGIALAIAPPKLQTHWGSGVTFTNIAYTASGS